MTVAAVITLGYGQGLKFIPTLGYGLGAGPTPIPDGTGRPGGYTYSPSHIKYGSEEIQREKIRKEKTELQKLESALQETERKKELAAQSRLAAQERKKRKRALELETLEKEYLKEINRLLEIRSQIMLRIRREEEMLMLLIMARKRRLRAF